MAIYHLEAKVVSRSAGQSAVAKAAYIARTQLKDERLNWALDYSAKDGLVFSGIFLPKDAPAWARDRAQLWNRAEAAEERKDSTIAREYQIALPHELTDEQRRYLVQDFVKENFTRQGYAADVNIHAPDAQGDNRNHHAHILVTDRRLEADGFAADKKERQGTKKEREERLEAIRESWERHANRHLERHGHEARIDRRTLKAQGIDREPTQHLGPHVAAMQRRGLEPNRYAELIQNSEIKIDLAALRGELAEVQRDIARETARAFDRDGPRITGRFAARDDDHQKQQQDAAREQAEKEAQRQAEKARAAESIREAWTASDGSGLSFMIELQDRGLQVARDPENGRFCAVAENGFVHGFGPTAHGEQGRAMQQALTAMHRDYAALILPSVEECRQEMAARREAAREARREAWAARETALSSDLSDVQAAIRLAYRLAPDGKAFAAMLEDKGLTLAEVGKVNAWASQNAHDMALLDQSRTHAPPILKEGELVVLNQYGNLYRLTQRTTGDGQTEIHAKLATLDRREVLSLDDARATLRDVQTQREKERELKGVQQRNERHAMAYPKPALRPPWAAPLQARRTPRDETPRPLHPDDHAQRMQGSDRPDPNRYLADSDYRREVWRQEAAKKEAQRDEREQAREEKRDRTEQTEQQQRKDAREALRVWKEQQPLWSRARGYDDDDGGGRERDR